MKKIAWASCHKCGRDYPEGMGTFGAVYDNCPNCGFELVFDYLEPKVFSLFEGRHQLPDNEGALCSGFDFERFQAIPTKWWDKALGLLKEGEDIKLYVTGLTPALTQFLSYANMYRVKARVILMHYNSQTGEYIEQIF